MPMAPKSYRPPHAAGTKHARYGGKSPEAYERAKRYRTKAWAEDCGQRRDDVPTVPSASAIDE
jgi:hypothetical protein